MTNLPQFAQQLATTPRLKRKFVTSNTTPTSLGGHLKTPDKLLVEAEGDKDRFIGSIAKVRRSSYQWEVWSFARGVDDKRKFTVVSTGRSKTLLAALSKVRFGFGQYNARKDAAKDKAA